ncbi:MAG: DegV family protein, partial [Dehalococcoidia bacterium]|nr:DegV family protein [Dehalococcoidia bacterium]
MRRVAVVTDSTACLPAELVREYSITVVPVEFTYQGRVYRDGVDITPAEVYQLLARNGSLPTTSAPPPGAYLKAFEQLSHTVREVLVITVSSTFSHTYDSARTAAEMAKEEYPDLTIKVVDCKTAAGAQGLVVLKAARAAAAGKSLEEVAQVARESISAVRLVAFLDTMYYLARGGRVPQVVAWAGNVLKIKPIMQIKPGSGQASLLTK